MVKFQRDVFVYLLGKIDSSIQFDNSNTPNDSFYFMKSYTSVNWKYDTPTTSYPNTEYNTPYKWLALVPMSNAIPQATGQEKTDAQTICYTTFNSLISSLSADGYRYYTTTGDNWISQIHNLSSDLALMKEEYQARKDWEGWEDIKKV